MADTHRCLEDARQRLKDRGDTFLDSAGEQLFVDLKDLAMTDADAAKAVREIEHRRSEKIE